MSTVSDDVVEAWPELWLLPTAWARLVDQPGTLRTDDVLDAVLEKLLNPLDTEGAFQTLVERGEFAAAGQFLELAPIRGDSDLVRRLSRRLGQARLRSTQSAESRGAGLRARSARLTDGRRHSAMMRRLDEAVAYAPVSAPRADALLQEQELELSDAESNALRELEDLLQGRLASKEAYEGQPWAESLKRALDARDFEMARWLIGESAQEHIQGTGMFLPPWRSSGPFAAVLPETAARWFTDPESLAPRNFRAVWGVREGDPASEALLAAVLPFVDETKAPGSVDVSTLLSVLERCLGVENACSGSDVEFRDGIFRGRLRGLPSPGFYAATTYVPREGLQVVVTGQSTNISDPAPDSPGGTVTLPSNTEMVGSEAYELYMHFGPRPHGWPADGAVVFKVETLFRLVGDEHRALNFRREIGSQIPLSRALPSRNPANDGTFAIGRDLERDRMLEGEGRVLWVGGRATGKSTLLSSAASEARRRGWNVDVLDCRRSDEAACWETLVECAVRAELACAAPDAEGATGAGAKEGPLYFIFVDALEALARPLRERVARKLYAIQGESLGRVRCVATLTIPTASPSLLVDIPMAVVGNVSFDACRVVATTVLDLVGVRPTEVTVLDRLAYYAGGHVGLLHAMLWSMLQQLEPRRPGTIVRIPATHVEAAFASASFREAANTMCVEPLAAHPRLRAMLAALILEQSMHTSVGVPVSPETLTGWPALLGVTFSEEQAEISSRELERLGLVTTADDGWRLPQSGVGLLLPQLLGPPEEYLEQALRDCPKDPSGRVLDE